MRGGSGEEPVPQDDGNWVSLVGILLPELNESMCSRLSGLGSLASLDKKTPPPPKKTGKCAQSKTPPAPPVLKY